MTAVEPRSGRPATKPPPRSAGIRPRRVALHVFLIVISLLWLFPLLWTVYTSLRPYGDTAKNGYVSIATSLSLDNYVNAWDQGSIPQFFLNTIIDPGAGRDHRPAAGVGDRVRRVALQLPVQPVPADAVHGRQPAAGRRSSSRRSTGCTCCCRCQRR